MECGKKYEMDYGTHLVYHKHANYVAMPINYPLPVQRVKWLLIHVCVHTSPLGLGLDKLCRHNFENNRRLKENYAGIIF